MNLIEHIIDQINKFIINTGKDPIYLYLGQDELLELKRYIDNNTVKCTKVEGGECKINGLILYKVMDKTCLRVGI